MKRKYPVGAEIVPKKGVHFRVWAPNHKHVYLALEGKKLRFFPMTREKGSYFSVLIKEAGAGSLYSFCFGKSKEKFPDPASRYQPYGPIGPSMVIDPDFIWTDKKWKGLTIEGQVIYEMHIGTFTKEGDFNAAEKRLPYLADLGITLIELMPLNDFPGKFGWGYDGVNFFAPCHLYGTPNDVKSFINAAHSFGIGIVLDVVYNHFGVENNTLLQFSKGYLHPELITDWGQAVNFDNPQSREFFLTNVHYWIDEFHFDGLRFDATPSIFSSTEEHVLAEMTKIARHAAGKKSILIIGENESQNVTLLRSYEEGGYGFDAVWNDDFHHTANVRLTGKREAYLTDYKGTPQEFISCAKYGYLYQGQYYDWQQQNRGTPTQGIHPSRFINFLENHDQLANLAHGNHLWNYADKGNLKALTCFLLLSPNTPLLFQGQEWGTGHTFSFFTDHSDFLNHLIFEGRKEFDKQFPRFADRERLKTMPNPSDISTFTKCKLGEPENNGLLLMHKDLIALRKKIFPVEKWDGAVLDDNAFMMRFFGKNDYLLIVNLSNDVNLIPSPEPLLAPPYKKEWKLIFSSEEIKYNGSGVPPLHSPHWKLLGHAAALFKS